MSAFEIELKFEKLLSKECLVYILSSLRSERVYILRLSKGLADKFSEDGNLHSARCCVMQEVFQTLQGPNHSWLVVGFFVINEGVKPIDSFAEGRVVELRVLRVRDVDEFDIFDIEV